jgi:hypothetical protein
VYQINNSKDMAKQYTLESKGKEVGGRIAGATSEASARALWGHACKWLLTATYIDTDGSKQPYGVHSYTVFVAHARKACKAKGGKFLELIKSPKIEDAEGPKKTAQARIVKSRLDAKALDKKSGVGAKTVYVTAPARMVAEALKMAKTGNAYERIIGLQLLTGRRTAEVVLIASKGAFSVIDSGHMSFNLALKKGVAGKPVPVLADAFEIAEALAMLGESIGEIEDAEIAKRRYQPKVSAPAKAFLQAHTQGALHRPHDCRAVYVAMCKEFCLRRSKLLPISDSLFTTQILMHKSGAHDVHYDMIKILRGDGYEW